MLIFKKRKKKKKLLVCLVYAWKKLISRDSAHRIEYSIHEENKPANNAKTKEQFCCELKFLVINKL